MPIPSALRELPCIPHIHVSGYPLHKENREITGNFEILSKHRENTGNLVCSSCEFPDSKGKKYLDISFETG